MGIKYSFVEEATNSQPSPTPNHLADSSACANAPTFCQSFFKDLDGRKHAVFLLFNRWVPFAVQRQLRLDEQRGHANLNGDDHLSAVS